MEADLGTPQRTRTQIRSRMRALHATEARVAALFVEQPNLVVYKSASEVGALAATSSATVVRTAQKLGFKGFHDLKLSLANELAVLEAPPREEQGDGADPRVAALAAITRVGAETVRDAGVLVDPATFAAAVEDISGARRVAFFGVGTSAPLCQDAAYRFAAIGLLAEAPADVLVQHVKARLMSPADVCVLVSHTGATRETVSAATTARTAGARTIAITSFATSPLTEVSDRVIVAGTRELALRLTVMASRLAHLAVIDALLLAVSDLDPARTERSLDLYADVLAEHVY